MADDAEDRVVLWAVARTNWLFFGIGLLNGGAAGDERKYAAEASPRGLLVHDPGLRRLSATGKAVRRWGWTRFGSSFIAWPDMAAVKDVYQPAGRRFMRITCTDGSRVELSIGHLTATSDRGRVHEARDKTSTVLRMMDRYRPGARPDGER